VKVLRAAPKPVFLVRASPAAELVRQRMLVRKILVPLDGSEVGATAIPHVETLARALDAELVLLHVLVEPVPVVVAPGVEFAYVPIMSKEEEGKQAAAAMSYLGGIEESLKQEGLKVSSEVTSGSPANEIIKYAEGKTVDLIALSTHGRSGIGRWFFGSVTVKVIQAGTTPMLVVRAKQE
jgi:nucleotide-binding universal stress UspA family protein